MKPLRIASRNSPLALWQANFVKDKLIELHPELDVEIVGMTTKGDRLLDRSLAAVGGKGLFLKELEVSLMDKETDIAVHSMKDVPVNLPAGLEIPVVCEREDARDAFVSNTYQNLYALPEGARVGTASLRRVSQLKHAFPGLEFCELRGNVNTRLKKLDDGDFDAIILAAAGLLRLGFEDRIRQYISPELCLPAVGQGIVGIECRSDDEETKKLIAPLHDKRSEIVLAAERSMNAALEGGCQVPIAGYATVNNGKLDLRGRVGAVDGNRVVTSARRAEKMSMAEAEALGEKVARRLIDKGASDLLAPLMQQPPEIDEPTGKTVLLTRQPQYLGNTPAILRRLDYQPTHVPLLQVSAVRDDALQAKYDNIADYTDIVFVSRNAVTIAMASIEKVGGLPKTIRIMAVGAETAKQLYRYGIDALFPEEGVGADALLKTSPMRYLEGRKVLWVRGESGLDWPAEKMRKRGAEVDEAICYCHQLPDGSQASLESLFANKQPLGGIFIHSSEALKNLIVALGHDNTAMLNTPLVVGSESIAEHARELDWRGSIHVSKTPSNNHMMIAFSEQT